MQITRYTSLNETQFLACASAFVDSLFGALNTAAMYLRKLEGQPKGSAFAFEMQLDTSRYGALIVLERWAELVHAFGAHLRLMRDQEIVDEAQGRVQTAENILGRANQLLDAAGHYSPEVVAACALAFQSLELTFSQEKEAVARMTSLGPMLPEEFREYRRVFLGDLQMRR